MPQTLTLGYICDRQLLLRRSGYSIKKKKKKNEGKPCRNGGLHRSESHPCLSSASVFFLLLHHRGDNTDLTPNTTPLAS